MNLFKAAADKASKPEIVSSKKSDNIVLVKDQEIAAAIEEFVTAVSSIKKYEADKEIANGTIVPFCKAEFVKQFASTGKKPASPKFRTESGSSITFITQDRGERYNVSDEQLEMIRSILGDRADKIVAEDMTYEFNNSILGKDGVMEALGTKVGELVSEGILTESEASDLLRANPRRTIRKGALDDLAKLCDGDTDSMETLMDALGSHMSAYIRS